MRAVPRPGRERGAEKQELHAVRPGQAPFTEMAGGVAQFAASRSPLACAMRRAMEGDFEGLENHEGQSALPDFGFVAHRGTSVTSYGKPIAMAHLLWLRNRKRELRPWV